MSIPSAVVYNNDDNNKNIVCGGRGSAVEGEKCRAWSTFDTDPVTVSASACRGSVLRRRHSRRSTAVVRPPARYQNIIILKYLDTL